MEKEEEEVAAEAPATDATTAAPAEAEQPKTVSFDEWKRQKEKQSIKVDTSKLRKANEGADNAQWANAVTIKAADADEEEEEEEHDGPQKTQRSAKKQYVPVAFTFGHSGDASERTERGRGRGGRGAHAFHVLLKWHELTYLRTGAGRGGSPRKFDAPAGDAAAKTEAAAPAEASADASTAAPATDAAPAVQAQGEKRGGRGGARGGRGGRGRSRLFHLWRFSHVYVQAPVVTVGRTGVAHVAEHARRRVMRQQCPMSRASSTSPSCKAAPASLRAGIAPSYMH